MSDSILAVPEAEDQKTVSVQRSMGRLAWAVFFGNVMTVVFFAIIYGLITLIRLFLS